MPFKNEIAMKFSSWNSDFDVVNTNVHSMWFKGNCSATPVIKAASAPCVTCIDTFEVFFGQALGKVELD